MARPTETRRQQLASGLLLTLALAACASPSPEEGRLLYLEHCATCHGEDGRGDPRRQVLGKGLDLTRSRLLERDLLAGPAVARTIRNGGELMPAYDHLLTPREVEAITAWVLTLTSPEQRPLEP